MTHSPSHEPLLDRKMAARYLSVSPGTLAVWDCTKRLILNRSKLVDLFATADAISTNSWRAS